MQRVYILVEGQTEESFVKDVLSSVLWPRQVYLTPVILGTPGHKGGNPKYARLKRDILALLKQDQTAYCSTMLDFYGLGNDFPGMPLSRNLSSREKVAHIEQAVKADIAKHVPNLQPDVRFLPYFQLHEYEALLFSDPVTFASAIGKAHLARQFEKIRNNFANPEDINDDPSTCPSMQVLDAYPSYRKVLDGTLAAKAITIGRMRAECRHFAEWVERLESLKQRVAESPQSA